MRDLMKEIIGNKRVANALVSKFNTVKNIEIFDKKEIAKRLIIILLISFSTASVSYFHSRKQNDILKLCSLRQSSAP